MLVIKDICDSLKAIKGNQSFGDESQQRAGYYLTLISEGLIETGLHEDQDVGIVGSMIAARYAAMSESMGSLRHFNAVLRGASRFAVAHRR